ncbi:hypothetical protein CGLO_18226 [Colletotrichum gloeosporioides Cg-14]|uniref:Uncharacterized protein n=1 Tax=Colletotrichum gloeosporioides (strain Cg-14) TaxID=1237896 RepID=T0JRY4_COLGC|nr:hypothetical protein CGLO_18226 [Colletotrichum gloeosporioides Cg-14]
MTTKPILTIDLVSNRQALVNATPGFTWPEALKGIYPNDESKSFSIPIAKGYGYNYTEHCQESLFFPYSRVYDCAAIAVSAILVQDGRYDTNAENIRKANESLNFGDLDSFDGIGVFRQILNCTRASCQGSRHDMEQLEERFGPCGEDIDELPSVESFRSSDLSKIFSPLESLCSKVTREPEPDIAGPGITMAYIMQIALGAWFILFSILIPQHPRTSVIVKAAKAMRRMKKRGRKTSSQREGRTESWLERLRASRFSVALFSAVVEFQEAQVFFTLAVQLASISMMVFNDSLSAIRIDWKAAKLFQAGNTLVVLLVQAELQRKKMHWWYTYLLTLMVCVFCLTIQQLGREDEWPGFMPLPECGNDDFTESILETCRSGLYDTGFDVDVIEHSFESYLSIILISISFITLDQVAQIPHLPDWVNSRVGVWRGESLAKTRTLKATSMFWCLLWFSMNAFLAHLSFYTTARILDQVGGTLRKKDKWTFGQIVAVLLWAPVVFKYFYLNIFGVEEGVGNRIDNHYKVVERGQDKSAPGPSQQSTDEILLTDTGYKNVPNIDDGREYGGLEDPRTPKWGRQCSASGRDGTSSVGSLEPQSFPWSNSR